MDLQVVHIDITHAECKSNKSMKIILNVDCIPQFCEFLHNNYYIEDSYAESVALYSHVQKFLFGLGM